MASRAAADHGARPGPGTRLPDAEEPELLVDVRRHPRRSCWWCRSSPASCWPCTTRRMSTMAFDSVEHIMRDVNYGWLHPLPPRQRRFDVLPRRLHPHLPRHVLRLLQGAARSAVDDRRAHLPRHDGDRLHGLCAALGPDELLGRQGHHQPVLGHPVLRRDDRRPGCGAASRSTTRPSTASSRCTICCPSCSPAWSGSTSGRCTCRATTIRPASA